MQLKDSILSLLEKAKDEIQSNFASKGINASGRTSASVRVVERDNHLLLLMGNDNKHTIKTFDGSVLSLYDTAPASVIERGYKGSAPYFYSIIYEWSKSKGITFEDDTARKRFAYFVSKKIKDKGTQRYRQNEDVFTSVVANTKVEIKNAIKEWIKYGT